MSLLNLAYNILIGRGPGLLGPPPGYALAQKFSFEIFKTIK